MSWRLEAAPAGRGRWGRGPTPVSSFIRSAPMEKVQPGALRSPHKWWVPVSGQTGVPGSTPGLEAARLRQVSGQHTEGDVSGGAGQGLGQDSPMRTVRRQHRSKGTRDSEVGVGRTREPRRTLQLGPAEAPRGGRATVTQSRGAGDPHSFRHTWDDLSGHAPPSFPSPAGVSGTRAQGWSPGGHSPWGGRSMTAGEAAWGTAAGARSEDGA